MTLNQNIALSTQPLVREPLDLAAIETDALVSHGPFDDPQPGTSRGFRGFAAPPFDNRGSLIFDSLKNLYSDDDDDD